jgi:uncharacterized protein (DUF2252 family)
VVRAEDNEVFREDIDVDAVSQIQDFNSGRDPERLQFKYRAMRTSPLAFLRGSCHLFYARLPRGGVLKSAPRVWCCGDLHLENFGSYKGDNRLSYFDVTDFDEAVMAPASWDLVRLLTSLRVGAGTLCVTDAQAQALCQSLVDSYADALAGGKAFWVERETAQGLVRDLLDRVRGRQREAFLDSRTVLQRGKRLLLTDGKKALPASVQQRTAVVQFMQGFAESQPAPGFYEVLDVARRIAGTGSLGVDRFVILVQGKGAPDGHYMLDLKEALPSSLLANLAVPQPRWKTEAHRIVAVQRRMQAVTMAFLQPVQFGERACVIRAMQPSEDRLSLNGSRHSPAELEQVMKTLGRLVAWDQLRSAGRDGSAHADELIDFGGRKKWRGLLLDASQACALQAAKDAKAFNQAWDDGLFVATASKKRARKRAA